MSIYTPKKITDYQSAYMAGIVDGEGSLCIGQYAKTSTGAPMWNVTLGISNTEELLIDWVCDLFGGAKLQYTRNQTPENSRKCVFRWQCTGDRLRHICNLILPYSVIKTRQIQIILEMLESLTQKTYAKGQRGPTVSKEIIDHRYLLMSELRTLHNRSGPLKHN